MTIFAAIIAICGLLADFLKIGTAIQQKEVDNSDVSNIQMERKALQEGAVDSVLADQHDRVERLLKEHGGS